MKRGFFKLVVLVALLSFALSGCAYNSAKKEIESAERSFGELKAAGGEKSAPYEYCSAESFLQVSKYTFAENNFKKTKEFAGRSKSASEAGLVEVKKNK
jgi:hypothetical protein